MTDYSTYTSDFLRLASFKMICLLKADALKNKDDALVAHINTELARRIVALDAIEEETDE